MCTCGKSRRGGRHAGQAPDPRLTPNWRGTHLETTLDAPLGPLRGAVLVMIGCRAALGSSYSLLLHPASEVHP